MIIFFIPHNSPMRFGGRKKRLDTRASLLPFAYQEELASKVWRLFKHRCEKRQVQNVLVYRNMTTDYDRAKKIEFLQPHILRPRKLIAMIGVIVLSLEHDWHRF